MAQEHKKLCSGKEITSWKWKCMTMNLIVMTEKTGSVGDTETENSESESVSDSEPESIQETRQQMPESDRAPQTPPTKQYWRSKRSCSRSRSQTRS